MDFVDRQAVDPILCSECQFREKEIFRCSKIKYRFAGFLDNCPLKEDGPVLDFTGVCLNPHLFDVFYQVSPDFWFTFRANGYNYDSSFKVDKKWKITWRDWHLKYMLSFKNVGRAGIIKEHHYGLAVYKFLSVLVYTPENLKEHGGTKVVGSWVGGIKLDGDPNYKFLFSWRDDVSDCPDVPPQHVEEKRIIPDVDPFENWKLPDVGEQMELF